MKTTKLRGERKYIEECELDRKRGQSKNNGNFFQESVKSALANRKIY